MSTKDFLLLGKETNKGSALHSLKDEGAAGAFDYARLNLSGVAVDTETFQLGDDVYEVHSILTDTGAESTVQVEVGDASITFDVAPTIPLVKDAVIRMESEYMIVIEVNLTGNTSVQVLRGQFGSTEAVHTVANSDTFQAAQLVTGKNFAVPIDDVAAAAFVIDAAAAVQFWTDGGYNKGLGGGIGVKVQNGLKVDAIVGPATDEVVFALVANGAAGGANVEGFTNGTLDAAFGSGVEEASQQYSVIWYVWTAADDTAGSKEFYAPFDVVEAVVTAFEPDGSPHRTQTGTDEVNFDGVVTVTANRFVSVSEGTTDVLVANDIIKVEFFG